MLSRCICIGALVIGLGCRVASEPEALPDGRADFRGTITRVWEDGGYLVDDGSATACGFTLVYVSEATEIWWQTGARARADELQVGRRVSVWQSGGAEPRCSTLQARAVVLERTPLW